MTKMEAKTFVNIATFSTATDAHLARNELESAGIPTQVTGGAAVDALWYIGGALGGVKLMVAEKDAPAAVKVLTELGVLDPDHELPDEQADESDRGAGKTDSQAKTAEDWEALANRAWRAAVFSLFLCPLLLNIYSFCLLFFNREVFDALDEKQRWKLWAAVAIDVVVFCMAGLVYWTFAWRQ